MKERVCGNSMNYIVIYSTIDKVTRNYYWDPHDYSYAGEQLLDDAEAQEYADNVCQCLEAGMHLEFGDCDDDSALNWGLNPIDPANKDHHKSNRCLIVSDSQYDYFNFVQTLTLELGKECVSNKGLLQMILKEAAKRAVERDGDAAEYNAAEEIGHVGAFNIAVEGIKYHESLNTDKSRFHMALTIKEVIEEYELFYILEIIPAE